MRNQLAAEVCLTPGYQGTMYINSVMAYVISVVHIFIKIPVCVRVLCMRAHPHTCVWKETSLNKGCILP